MTTAKTTTKKTASGDHFYQAVGRRKSAVASVRLFESSKMQFLINDREMEAYFPTEYLSDTARASMVKPKIAQKFKVVAKVRGGGVAAQAEAVRLGIARALTVYDAELRGKLKKEGFLKRDSRIKERRKFGLKKARKASQWSKR